MDYNQLPKLNNNGFITFDFDIDDDTKLYRHLKVDNPAKENAKDIAYTYLKNYLEAKAKDISHKSAIKTPPKIFGFIVNKQYTNNTSATERSSNLGIDYKHLQTKELKITNTQLVKFRQLYKKVPIYGSLATIELGKANELIGISANFGQPIGVSPKPKISSLEEIKSVISKAINQEKDILENLELKPNLYYYFDQLKKDWRLVYFVETKLEQKSFTEVSHTIPKLVDYIIDAHTQEVISELPHVMTLTAMSNNDKKQK